MYAFKPYLYLNKLAAKPYMLYVALAVPEKHRVSEPQAGEVNEEGLRSYKIVVTEDHTQISFAPFEAVISIEEASVDPAVELGIEVKVVLLKDGTETQKGVNTYRYDDADPQNGSTGPGTPPGGGGGGGGG